MAKDYIYAVTPLLVDALMERWVRVFWNVFFIVCCEFHLNLEEFFILALLPILTKKVFQLVLLTSDVLLY